MKYTCGQREYLLILLLDELWKESIRLQHNFFIFELKKNKLYFFKVLIHNTYT